MREILFRGKTTNRKIDEWIEGSLMRGVAIHDREPVNFIYGLNTETDSRGWIGNYWGEKVDPETVGQYTGFVDKNGVKIFEGDIVTINSSKIGVGIKYTHRGWLCYTDKLGPYWGHYLEKETVYEVIGNIHDNPELLKEEI